MWSWNPANEEYNKNNPSDSIEDTENQVMDTPPETLAEDTKTEEANVEEPFSQDDLPF